MHDQSHQQRLPGTDNRPGGETRADLNKLAQLIWEASPDASWSKIADRAAERGLLGDGGERRR